MRRAAVLLALVAVGCAGKKGVALDLTIDSACAPADEIARVSAIELVATATPSLGKNGTASLSPATLFASPGTSNRVMLLLPTGTTHVELTLTARDQSGADAGSAQRTYSFDGPGVRADTITLQGEGCDGGSDLGSDDLAGADLAGADLAGADLAGTADMANNVHVTSVVAQGMLPMVYEGEGSTQPPGSGVAVLITGSGFTSPAVTSSVGVVGPVFASADGTRIATSIQLPVDPTLNAGFATQVTLTVTTAGGMGSGTFAVNGLDELAVTAPMVLTPPGNAPLMYSHVDVALGTTLTLGGSNRGFLWVTGTVTGLGTIVGNGGGNAGCTSSACGLAAGPGHGANGATPALGGGGAGYFQNGNDGASSSTTTTGGGAGGVLYGDTSLITLPGGSGGGAGGNGAVGGAGGGVLRLFAGGITNVNFAAVGGDGATGQVAGSGGGGAGSGGTIHVQSLAGLATSGAVHTLDVSAGTPGPGAGTGGSGGAAASGRVRVDVATVQDFSAAYSLPASLKYEGGMPKATMPTAYVTLSGGRVTIVCGLGTSYDLLLDTQNLGTFTCGTVGSAPDEETRTLPVVVAPGMHIVCVNQKANGGSNNAHYSGQFAENMTCRSIVSAD